MCVNHYNTYVHSYLVWLTQLCKRVFRKSPEQESVSVWMALRVHTYVLLMYNCVSWVAVAVAGWGSHICIYLMQQTDCWNCQKLNFSSYFIQAHSSTPQLLTHLRPKCTPSEWVTRQSVKLKLAGTFYCAQIYSQIHSFFFLYIFVVSRISRSFFAYLPFG